MNKQGFTLVELLVSLGIFSILIIVLNSIFLSGYMGQKRIINQNELQQNLHIGIEEMIDDIQHSQGLAIGEQSSLSRNQLQLYTYLLKSEGGGYHWQKVKYYLDVDLMTKEHLYQLEGKTLYRKINNGQAQPIANFIKEMTIHYYDDEGNSTVSKADIAMIEVRLMGQSGKKEYEVSGRGRLLIPKSLEGEESDEGSTE